MPNIIYVLTNEAMPGLVKIGFTQELVQRLRDLSKSAGVPLPFVCHYAAEVDDPVFVERKLQQLFSDHRVNPRREFFRIPPEKVVLALQIGGFRDVTPVEDVVEDEAERAAAEKVRARRERINLDAIGVPVGAVLTFSRNENRTCDVIPGNKVIMGGEELSPSLAALKVLQEMGLKSKKVSGSQYWQYEGESLEERRWRIEETQFNDDGTP